MWALPTPQIILTIGSHEEVSHIVIDGESCMPTFFQILESQLRCCRSCKRSKLRFFLYIIDHIDPNPIVVLTFEPRMVKVYETKRTSRWYIMAKASIS